MHAQSFYQIGWPSALQTHMDNKHPENIFSSISNNKLKKEIALSVRWVHSRWVKHIAKHSDRWYLVQLKKKKWSNFIFFSTHEKANTLAMDDPESSVESGEDILLCMYSILLKFGIFYLHSLDNIF